MNRRLLTIIAALVLAALGTLAVLAYANSADDRALAGKRAVRVVVAAKPIPAGTLASRLQPDGLIRIEKMPAQTVPSDAMSSVGPDVQDLVTSSNIQTGAMVLRPLLVAKGEQSSGFVIPNGKIAMTVALTDPQRVAGYVQSGSRVAIFATFRLLDRHGKPISNEARETRLLLNDVQVLSIGPAKGSKADDRSAAGKTLVTVAVTQHEAEKLVFASEGALSLGLLTDTSQISEDGTGVNSFNVAN